MARRRGPDFDLARAAEDPSFSPGVRDLPALLDLALAPTSAEEGERLGEGKVAKAAIGALGRAGGAALPSVLERLEGASPRERPLLVRLLGRLVPEAPGAETAAATEALIRLVEDADPRVQRHAARALARLELREAMGDVARRALARALERRPDGKAGAEAKGSASDREAARAALALALGRLGGEEAARLLGAGGIPGGALPEGARARAELFARRDEARERPARVRFEVEPPRPLEVALHVRSGLEPLLLEEIAARAPALAESARPGPTSGGEGRVLVRLRAPLASLHALRIPLSFGILLPEVRLGGGEGALAEGIAEALAGNAARALLASLTEGALRFRLAFASGGKRRAVVHRAAELLLARAPELVNDPAAGPWEARVLEKPGALRLELVPRAADPRFAYRAGDVPAASHPTVAAALVRLGGVRPGERVWDPFVGSGLELCERHLAGGPVTLLGSDRDPHALAVARKNLEAASASDFLLVEGDSRSLAPPFPVDLVLSNPPMGRRLLEGRDLGALLEATLRNVRRALAPGGRIAWVSALPARTRAAAEALGLEVARSLELDMGGFRATAQLLVERRAAGRPARRRDSADR